MADIFEIAGRIHSTSQEGVATVANEILDETQNKKQSEVNIDVARHENEIHGTGGIDSRLSDVEQLAEISIGGGDAQIATGADFTNPDATKRAKVPTVGAIVDGLNDGVYDVSKRNPTAGPNSDGKFTLDYILNNANTLIPTGWRHGGMTISFVQSSDNKYIQTRCMAQNFTTDTTQWQGVDSEITAGSKNLAESGAVKEALSPLENKTEKISYNRTGTGEDSFKITNDEETETIFEATDDGVDAKNLKSNGKNVITEDDLSLLATKQELSEKQDKIEAIEEESEHTTQDNIKFLTDNGDIVTEINENGIKAKDFIDENSKSIQSSNVLFGKKYVSCGDSFTAGAFQNATDPDYIFLDEPYKGEYKVYPFFIGRRNRMTIVNEAIGGSTMTNINDNSFSNTRYKNLPADADYITLYFGINDANNQCPIGTIEDATRSTFYGAWNTVMNYLINHHPQAKIGIIITNGCSGTGGEDYCEAERQIAKKFGVPYLDLDKGENVPLVIRTNKTDVDISIRNLRNWYWYVNNQDSTPQYNPHPNAKAHEYESTFIENFLRTL